MRLRRSCRAAVSPLSHPCRQSSSTRNRLGGDLEIAGERLALALAPLVVALAQDRRRMDGRDDDRREVRLKEATALLGHLERVAEQRLGRDRAHDDQRLGADHAQLRLEPWVTGADVARVGTLVDAALPAFLEPEVLDRVGEVDVRAVDAGALERLVELAPRRADERMALVVLAVAGRLADEHRARRLPALAEDRLRRVLVEITPATPGCRLPQGCQRQARWQELAGIRHDV